MKKIKIASLCFLFALGATSCSDFLDRYPDSAIPEKDAMKTLDDCSEVVTGIYSEFKNGALYSGPLTILPDIQADMAYASSTNMGQYTAAYRWEIKPNDTDVESIYAGLYKIVARCNFFLDYKDQVYETLTKEEDKKTFEKRLGDVYFARALAFADLIRTFCEAYTEENKDTPDMGISLPMTYAEAVPKVKRSTLYESYKQVLDDLEQAEKYIPAERSVADSPYFSIGAVNALRARVCLYMLDYEGAVKAATKVIGSKIYTLADATTPYATVGDTQISEYQYMWRYDEADEIIWKVAMSSDSYGGSLGNVFLNYNGATYNPQYIFSEQILNLYESNDFRTSVFCAQQENSAGNTVYMIVKYPGNPNLDGGLQQNFINMPKPLRLSEVYLIRAEAYYNLGKATEASQDLTALKRKRYQSFGSFSAEGEDLIKEIRNERIRELYMEGFRLSDMKRWGLDLVRKKQLYTMDGPSNNELKRTKDHPLFTWPIPKNEIEATNGVVKGNRSNGSNN